MKKNLIKSCIALTFIGVSVLLLASCKSMMDAQNPMMSIKQGMTKQEVYAIMGEPKLRRFNESGEEWLYERSKFFETYNYAYLIDFADDRVSAMDSYRINIPNQQQPNVVNVVRPSAPREYHNYGNRQCYLTRDDEFARLLSDIKNEPFKDNQMKRLPFVVNGNRLFTCRQCVGLMSITPFQDEKKTIFRMVAPYIVDAENYKIIVNDISVFSEDEVRNTLMNNRRRY